MGIEDVVGPVTGTVGGEGGGEGGGDAGAGTGLRGSKLPGIVFRGFSFSISTAEVWKSGSS